MKTRSEEISDEELVRQIQRDPSRAAAKVDELLGRHYPWVFRMCLAELRDTALAVDCTQEVMLAVARGLASFRIESRFSTWVFTILRRTARRMSRREVRRSQRVMTESSLGESSADTTAIELAADGGPSADLRLVQDEERQILTGMISELPERQRHAVTLHYFEGLSVEEAAHRLGCSPSSVKTHLSRARQALKTKLEQADESR
ncbi:MAG: RNA polymerase sigma factor [Bdellovibrionales bacterium]|nr:RNA polymerase sigma factor [Bdellovibrionales bacterium]